MLIQVIKTRETLSLFPKKHLNYRQQIKNKIYMIVIVIKKIKQLFIM